MGFPLADRKGQRAVDDPVFQQDCGDLRDIFLRQRLLQSDGRGGNHGRAHTALKKPVHNGGKDISMGFSGSHLSLAQRQLVLPQGVQHRQGKG